MTLKQTTNLVNKVHQFKELKKFRDSNECKRLCRQYRINSRQMNFVIGLVAVERVKFQHLTDQILSTK